VSTPDAGQPQVAWIAIDEGAVVVGADGTRAGIVKEVAGDEGHDIFDGLVLDGDRYVAAERVKGIWPDRIETDLSAAEIGSLPPFKPSPTTEWHPDDGGFGTRLRRAWHELFRRRR
jgi:hypothetical protein